MTQMNQAVAALKLRVAELRAEDEKLLGLARQFKAQLRRVPRQTMYGKVPLDLALGSMAEIEERLNYFQTRRRHLLSILEQAGMELQALELVQRIETAKKRLAALRRQRNGAEDEDIETQIVRLESHITQYSKEAERAITTGSRGRDAV